MNYVIDENNSLVNANIQEIAFNAAHPVGEIYIQYPGKKDPQTLYGRGTWENISDQFAGLFFRAEGGNAESFQETVDSDNPLVSQDDKIRGIKGAFYTTHGADGNTAIEGAFYHRTSSDYWTKCYIWSKDTPTYVGFIDFDVNQNVGSGLHQNAMAGHADGPEIRPVNTTIRVWERTA